MPLGEGDAALVVVEDELKVAEVLVEPAPVQAEDVTLLVVPRPHAGDLVVGLLPEIGALGAGDDPRTQVAAASRRAACKAAAAGPGLPSPIGLPSSSTTGITSRTEDDVNASSAPASSSTG